jgi:hypothetical protein
MHNLKLAALFLFAAAITSFAAVTTVRVPNGGIQPQIVERDGVIHMIYFTGPAEKGSLFYVSSHDYGATFSKPIPVNHAADAIAVGNIRGAQLAVGRNGRVFVAWNGVEPAGHLPMLVTRLNDAATAFEPERNVITKAYGLDGGGSIAADNNGDVYVFWHAPLPGTTGEQNRRIWIAKSTDDGKTFAPERLAFENPVGACGCCGMKAYADGANVYVLFRSADQIVNRDIWLLSSTDRGQTFKGSDVSHWNIGACVMSSADLVPSPSGMLAAWETEKQTYFGRVADGKVASPVAAPGAPRNRKYPVLAVNSKGETLFAWTEGNAWKRQGAIEWELLDRQSHATAHSEHDIAGVPAFSVIAAFAKPDGDFVVVY